MFGVGFVVGELKRDGRFGFAKPDHEIKVVAEVPAAFRFAWHLLGIWQLSKHGVTHP